MHHCLFSRQVFACRENVWITVIGRLCTLFPRILEFNRTVSQLLANNLQLFEMFFAVFPLFQVMYAVASFPSNSFMVEPSMVL